MNHNNPPANSFPEEPRRVVLNGPRPSPLRVNKDSHVIQKPSLAAKQQQQQNPRSNQPRKQPVIIYTHSPKIIHTKPKDFMALVQKLTGFTRPEDNSDECHGDHKRSEKSVSSGSHEDNDSSSVTSDDHHDKFESGGAGSEVSPVHKGLINGHPYFTDFPLFTPNSNNLFSCSPQPMFRYPDVVFTPLI